MGDLTPDRAFFTEYMDDMNYSQGFYVTPGRDGCVVLGGVWRIDKYADDGRYNKAERAAKFAVEKHNSKEEKKESLKFIKIVNLNVEPTAGAIYYITAEVADASGEICHYQLKIWETLNSRYRVDIFRPAPYWLKISEKQAYEHYRVRISKLKPWMDETYLYYKCFLGTTFKIVGVEVIQGKEGTNEANIWFNNSVQKEKTMNKFGGRKMPHSDILFAFN